MLPNRVSSSSLISEHSRDTKSDFAHTNKLIQPLRHEPGPRVIDLTADEDADDEPSSLRQQPTGLMSTQGEAWSICLLRQNLHRLDKAEQAALETVLQRFIDDAIFRNTLVQNGPAVATASATNWMLPASCQPRAAACVPMVTQYRPTRNETPPPRLLDFIVGESSPMMQQSVLEQPARSPFLDLPPEIRIMIARYTLYHPEGLEWKWNEYRSNPRTATLSLCGYGRWERSRLSVVNGLSHTCTAVYSETRGLLLSLNTIHFQWATMHDYKIPMRCQKKMSGHSAEAEGLLEAFEMFQSSAFVKQCPTLVRCVLCIKQDHVLRHVLSQYLVRFQQVSCASTSAAISVRLERWSMFVPSKADVDKAIIGEGGDPVSDDEDIGDTSERVLVRRKLSLYWIEWFLDTGKELKSKLEQAELEESNRTWRFRPNLGCAYSQGFKAEDFRGLLTSSDYDLLESFLTEGV